MPMSALRQAAHDEQVSVSHLHDRRAVEARPTGRLRNHPFDPLLGLEAEASRVIRRRVPRKRDDRCSSDELLVKLRRMIG